MTDIRVAAEQARVALQATLDGPLKFSSHGVVPMLLTALASLEAALAALPGDKRPVAEVSDRCSNRVGWIDTNAALNLPEGTKLYVHSAATPTPPVPQIAGRDGASAAPSDEGPTDTQLIDMLRDEAYDICSFAMPTGQGDADVGWQVRGYYMDTPNIRVVGEAYRDDPREALTQAWMNLVAKRVMDGPRQVAHSSQAQGELSVNPVVTNNGRMNEENQNG